MNRFAVGERALHAPDGRTDNEASWLARWPLACLVGKLVNSPHHARGVGVAVAAAAPPSVRPSISQVSLSLPLCPSFPRWSTELLISMFS